MGINDNFWSLSSYRVNEIPRVSTQPESVQPVVEDEKPANAASLSIEPKQDNRPKFANLNEVSISFNRQENYDYIGKDRDAGLLDMQKAVSDMRQDTVLSDYRYFVGNSNNIFQSEDGVVIAKPKMA